MQNSWLRAVLVGSSFTILGAASFACTAVTEELDPTNRDSAPDGGDGVVDATIVPKSDADATVAETGPDVADAKHDVSDASDARDANDANDAMDANDAADAYAPEGSPCTAAGAVEQRPCGFCGTQNRICLDKGAGPVWQPWGGCANEVPNGCVAGTSFNESCGSCGTRPVQCTSLCTKVVGLCSEPTNACEPGFIEYADGLSCDAGSGRTSVCEKPRPDGGPGGCTYSLYSLNCVSAPTTLSVPTVLGDMSGTTFTLSGTMNGLRQNGLDAGCYPYSTSGSYTSPYAYVRVLNPNNKPALVTLWAGNPPDAGGMFGYTAGIVIATYPAQPTPITNFDSCTSYDMCSYSSAQYCQLDAGFGLTSDGGPTTSPRPLVPANGEILLVVSGYYTYYFTPSVMRVYVRLDELK